MISVNFLKILRQLTLAALVGVCASWPTIVLPSPSSGASFECLAAAQELLGVDGRKWLARFKEDHASTVYVGADVNRAYYNIANNVAMQTPDMAFFGFKNLVQKKLNTDLDLEAVDAINGYMFKLFLEEIKGFNFAAMYQGAGNFQVAIKGIKTPLERTIVGQAMSNAFNKAAERFAKNIDQMPLKKIYQSKLGVSDPKLWYGGGFGKSYDELSTSLNLWKEPRIAKQARSKGLIMNNVINYANHVEDVFDIMAEAKRLEGSYFRYINTYLSAYKYRLAQRVVDTTTNRSRALVGAIPSDHIIDILRKNSPSMFETSEKYYQFLAKEIKTQLHLPSHTPLSRKFLEDLSAYYTKIDSISPELLQRTRVTIPFSKCKYGFFKIDVGGLGRENIKGQMAALAFHRQIPKCNTLAEKSAFTRRMAREISKQVGQVTEDLIMIKRYVNRVFQRFFHIEERMVDGVRKHFYQAREIKLPEFIHFTGDEIVGFQLKYLTGSEKTDLVKMLMNPPKDLFRIPGEEHFLKYISKILTRDSGRLRTSFTPTRAKGEHGLWQLIKKSMFSVQISIAESFEKGLRRLLIESKAVSLTLIRTTFISVQYLPRVNQLSEVILRVKVRSYDITNIQKIREALAKAAKVVGEDYGVGKVTIEIFD